MEINLNLGFHTLTTRLLMKRLFLLLYLMMHLLFLFAQNRQADSLQKLLAIEKSDKRKVDLLSTLCFVYEDSKPDSALLLAQRAYLLAKNIRYTGGESLALGQVADAYKSLGNFPKSLEYYIAKLKIEETYGSPVQLTVVYLSIASLYNDSRDPDKGLFYAKKADSIINQAAFIYPKAGSITRKADSTIHKNDSINKNILKNYAPYSLLDIGDIYEKKNLLDSAIPYTRQALDVSLQSGNTLLIGTAFNNLGNIYSKTGDYTKALANYHAGIPYELFSNDYSTYAESTLGIAKIAELTGAMDSAFWYGKKSYAIATGNQFTVKALNASSFLSKLYKKNNHTDSAFAYQEIMSALKDSVESREKIRDLQNISTAEQLRQAELEQQRQEQVKDREEKLQFLFIGIMIPIFFLFSIVISRRKVHKKLIEFTGIVSVLLFFEYITLLLHPFIAEKSHHSPVIEIIIFVGIAAIITPTHHKIQHWLLTKLAEYNYLKHHQPVVEPEKNITEADPEETEPVQ